MTQKVIFLKSDPNKDILEAIYRMENRAEKMLTLSIVLMSVNFFTQTPLAILIASPLFFSSVFFYFFAFIKSPTILGEEMSREKMAALIEIKEIKEEGVSKIIQKEKDFRKLLFNLRNKKLIYIQIAHSSFLTLIIMVFVTFLIEKFSPVFFESKTQVFLYEFIFILIPLIFFLTMFKKIETRLVIPKAQK